MKKKNITKCSQDLPHTCLDILPLVPPYPSCSFSKKYFQNRSPPPFSSHSFSKRFSNQVEPPPVRGERGTRRQHCKQHLQSRCKTSVQRHSRSSLMSPRQLLTGEENKWKWECEKKNLRKADKCSRQTARSQNATRRRHSPRFERREVDKTGRSLCQSGSLRRPGEKLMLKS